MVTKLMRLLQWELYGKSVFFFHASIITIGVNLQTAFISIINGTNKLLVLFKFLNLHNIIPIKKIYANK